MENGHRVGNNNGNRNRTRGMRCEVERDGDWGSERGLGMGNMKQANIGNMKPVGEQNQERGYERISRNDKVGNNRPN